MHNRAGFLNPFPPVVGPTSLMWLVLAGPAAALPERELPLPTDPPSAMELARQVRYVNRFLALDNISFGNGHRAPSVLIDRPAGRRPLVNAVELHINSDYPEDGEIEQQGLAIFRSGKLRGTGILVTSQRGPGYGVQVTTWLPALRKIRRINTPAHDDRWPGMDLTYGEMLLRRPEHENHQILATEPFGECLQAMAWDDPPRGVPALPEAQCGHRDRPVYVLKSTTHYANWWYDYRLSYLDTGTFADYRIVYYKGDQAVKLVDRDWVSLGLADPRAQYPRYVYTRNHVTGQESLGLVPDGSATWNQAVDPGFWSEKTLRRLKR